MESDPNLLLPLLVVRMLGGESVPKSEPVVKAVSRFATEAKNQGLLDESRTSVQDLTRLTKSGRPRTRSIQVYSLSEKGKEYLEQTGSPAGQIAARVSMIGELKHQLEADRRRLREAIENAAKEETRSKSAGPSQKDWDALVKKVDDLAKRLEKWSVPTGSSESDAFAGRIDAAFANLTEKLEQALSNAPQVPPVVAEAPEGVVWDATKRAYEFLQQRAFRIGGIVKIPELADEVQQEVEGLTRQRFHNYLEKWQNDDKLVLQGCDNSATEERASEGIPNTGRGLLFYVFIQ